MNDKLTVLAAGLDRRMLFAAEALSSTADVYYCGTGGTPELVTPVESPEQLNRSADLILLPMMNACGSSVPTELGRLPVSLIAEAAKPGAVAAGGLLPDSLVGELTALDLLPVDYFRSEELQIRNALLTAEGALSVTASQCDETLYGMTVLITGWGRVAKACARLFCAVGSKVTVAARSPAALAEAECSGCCALPIGELADSAERFKVLINTIPALILTDEIIRRTQRNCLIVDLASKPGGVDSSACAICGRSFVHALSLPGKYAPRTAGCIIAETVRKLYSSVR